MKYSSNEIAELTALFTEFLQNYQRPEKEEERTLAELYLEYLTRICGQGSSRAFGNKVLIAKRILADIGNQQISELTTASIARYLNKWTQRTYFRAGVQHHYAQSYIDKIYTQLKSVLSMAVDDGIFYTNPMDKVICPISQAPPKDDMPPYSQKEIQTLLLAFSNDPWFYAQAVILLYTGIRPGELWPLCFTDFDFEKHTVKIRRALSVERSANLSNFKTSVTKPMIKGLKNEIRGKKNYARRELFISPIVENAVCNLRSFIEQDELWMAKRLRQKNSQYLFAKQDGCLTTPDLYAQHFRQKLYSTGLDPKEYVLYRFRHTFCTRLFKELHLDPKTVQRMMGDNSIDIVMRVYNSINNDDVLAASRRYAQYADNAYQF